MTIWSSTLYFALPGERISMDGLIKGGGHPRVEFFLRRGSCGLQMGGHSCSLHTWAHTRSPCCVGLCSLENRGFSDALKDLFLFSFLELLEIRLGEHIRSSTSESSITRDFKVSSITNHPQYAGSSNDIALVRLKHKTSICSQQMKTR